tara:strand:+ start:38 stop:1285 length:1248 start_codon:yes stop_codon:yes gene_type:complete
MSVTTAKRTSAPTREWYIPRTTKSFTRDHLAQHNKVWNEETQPEQTIELSRFGLYYHQSTLRPSEDLNVSDTKALTQHMRAGSATNKNELTAIMTDRGVDLRCKQQHVLVNDDGEVVLVFSGNTTHAVLTDQFEVDNRIVHEFKMGQMCTPGSVTRAGVFVNSLEVNGSSPATYEDAKKAIVISINEKIDARFEYKSSFAEDIEGRNQWLNRCVDEFNQMTSNKYKTSSSKINVLRTELLVSVGEEVLETIKDGDALLAKLREDFPGRYNDTPDVKHRGFSAVDFDKIPRAFSCMTLKTDEEYKGGFKESDTPAKYVENRIMLSCRQLDPRKEIRDFLKVAGRFVKQLDEYETGFSLKNDIPAFHANDKILGMYNPSSKVEEHFQSKDKERFSCVRRGRLIPLEVIRQMLESYTR